MRFIVLVLIVGLSCSTKKSDNDNEQIEKQIIGFLTWYSSNHDSLSNKSVNAMIDNIWREPPDSTKPYKINFEKSEVYLNTFKKSGFVSETYANNQRDYFKTCQTEFEKNPQYFGPPTGFDFDLIFRMQDFKYELNNPTKAQVTDLKVDNDKAQATVKFTDSYGYRYSLTKTDGVWLIDKIKASWEN